MDQAFIEQQKECLLTLRSEDQEALQQLQAETAEGIAETEVKEPEEVAAINMQHKVTMAESNLLQERLADIDRALHAIADGSYGVCDRCSKTIAPARLEANSMARHCLPCQELVDAQ